MSVSHPRILLAIIVVGIAASARANAPAGRYTTGNGTVLDTMTKLTWQQPFAPGTYTWAAAKTYCAGLGSTLGGTGWRLPTLKELLTLVDYSQATPPRIDTTAFPGTPSNSIFFWSATPVPAAAVSSPAAWDVSFDDGADTDFLGTGYNADVRCVR